MAVNSKTGSKTGLWLLLSTGRRGGDQSHDSDFHRWPFNPQNDNLFYDSATGFHIFAYSSLIRGEFVILQPSLMYRSSIIGFPNSDYSHYRGVI